MSIHKKASKSALAIFSFNRPHYLKDVLASLVTNQGLNDIDFYFIQDGAINLFSERIATDEQVIIECLRLWEECALPNKRLIRHAENKGIGISQFEAKVFLFEQMQYDQVMFFEDDLVLSRHYVRILKIMLDQYRNERAVGAVMCHGGKPSPHLQNKKHVLLNRVRFANDNLWGWATWKDRWQKIKPAFLDYYEFIKDIDYKRKGMKREQILAFYKKNGFIIRHISQDAAVQYAFVKNDLTLVQTEIHRGLYIGAIGEHMTQRQYDAIGYPTISFPTDHEEVSVESFTGYDESKFLCDSKSMFRRILA